MEISFCRIDDRLIHGQIATIWAKAVGCNRIICVSDDIAKDEMRRKLLLQVVPSGLKGYVVSVDDACNAYFNPQYNDFKAMFIFKNPTDVLRAVKGGIPFKSVNFGGKAFNDGDTKLSSAVNVNSEDVESLKKLVKMGIEIEIRKLADDPKINIVDALKENNLW